MSSSSKLTICIILAMLIAAMAIIAVIAVWAARKQVFLSFIDVRYKSMEVTGQASARWKVGHENWQDMTVGGEADGDTILTFGEAVNDSSSLSPTNKNILLSSFNNYIVFEYKFTNTGSNEYAIDLFYTDDEIKDTNISVFSLNSDEEITTDFEENINTAYVDWTNTKISGNGGTKYVYILASVTQLGKDAKYSGSFQFNLDGKDYSDELEFDGIDTITGLKNDNLSVVRIPSEIDGVAVKKIAKGAFADKSTLIELTIPDSVEEIKSGALNNGCSNLKYISIPFVGSKRTIISNFGYIFGGDAVGTQQSYIPTTLTNVIITDCTAIGNYAFAYCVNLKSVTIPDSVTSIGEYAFSSCSGLTGDLYIPESITTIGNGAFKGCSGFTNIQVNSNNKNYTSRDNAGTECNCLIDLTNKTLILGCNISIIPVDGSVTSIGDNAFYKCIGLTGQLAITNSVTSIGDAAFAGCKGLTSLTIEEGVNAIGESAFSSCSGLTGKLTIPGSVTEIGSYAFASCSGLTSLTIEEGVKYIRSYAFQYCSGLTSVIISSTVRGIEWLAFLNCDKLRNVTIDSGYIYTNAELFSCGQIFYNAETIRALSNLVVEGHKFFNSTYFIMGSTEMDGEKEYTMYKSKYSH